MLCRAFGNILPKYSQKRASRGREHPAPSTHNQSLKRICSTHVFFSYRLKEHLNRDLPTHLSAFEMLLLLPCVLLLPFLEAAMLRHYHTVSHTRHRTAFALRLLLLAGFTPTWTSGPLNRKEGLKSCPDTSLSREGKNQTAAIPPLENFLSLLESFSSLQVGALG